MSRISSAQIYVDPEDLRKIVGALGKIERISEEAVLSKAVNATLRKAQRVLSHKAKISYAGEASKGIRDRSKIEKAVSRGIEPEGTLRFRSEQHAITKFKFSPRNTPTKFLEDTVKHFRRLDFKSQKRPDGRTIGVKVGKQKRYYVHAGQIRGNKGKLFHDVFVVQFKSGHIALAERAGKARFPINQILGSSDMMMTKSKRVFGAEKENIEKFYTEQCAKSLAQALQRLGKA